VHGHNPIIKKGQRPSVRALKRDPSVRRYIYAVQGEKTGLVKIGIATNIRQRLSTFRTHSPDVLRVVKVLGPITRALEVEQTFHEAFAEQRKHGEWFEPNEALMNTIAGWIGESRPSTQRVGPLRSDHTKEG
jgi:hypothetical protein